MERFGHLFPTLDYQRGKGDIPNFFSAPRKIWNVPFFPPFFPARGYGHIAEKFDRPEGYGPDRVRRFAGDNLVDGRTPDQWRQDAFGVFGVGERFLAASAILNSMRVKSPRIGCTRTPLIDISGIAATREKRVLRRPAPLETYSNRQYNKHNMIDRHLGDALMPRTANVRDDRLQVRLDARSKSVLRRAAGYRRRTVSQFVLATALEEAEKVIRENEVVALSAPDWKVFYDALARPPAPNAALRKAFAKYKRSIG
jgi:uncharacterized protein (DUF1778 family)